MADQAAALREVWERMGRVDPLWAVMSYPERRGGKWTVEEFLGAGVRDLAFVRDLMDRHGVGLGERVLDFGCGVGRLSKALSTHVPKVVGVDIADSMLRLAREFNPDPGRTEFLRIDGRRLPFEDDSFDSAISLTVLQHSPPQVQIAVLAELARVIRPGGLLAIQAVSAQWSGRPLGAEACQAEITILEAPASIRPGAAGLVRARVTNRGTQVWPVDEEIRLGNHWLRDEATTVRDDGRTDLPYPLRPGESAELTLSVRAPQSPGGYVLELDMMQELVAWWAQYGSPTARVTVECADEAEPAQHTPPRPLVPPAPDLRDGTEGIEMHPIPVSLLQALFSHFGGHVLTTEPDPFSEPPWDSRTYLVTL
ncbi:methyltransferase domain-containing protein [Amycolatopsis rubida]|uniref:Methyltransferase domain-containing protein n=1 Tax=Amycolatopsis rubida TaxID=112413 RepID=A0ABX0BN05_9PSEU|nr:methyltransferase domain-containing protein [Amycolatopsis sp. M39]MYW91761.1 methyltransferase domain-containing protein [Amycolatopsis rubida]NEC56746.1 methyltransferase domain-containing protein [Amycolatopsis rubida]OAP21683.1 Demethylrebeccamycin-D-glucose O-methyltransferase [Amycolatopsis sp. M39]